MDVRSLESALTIITEEMRIVGEEFEHLKVKKDRLQAILVNLTALLEDGGRLPIHQAGPQIDRSRLDIDITSAAPLPIEIKPSWRIILDVFPKNGGSLTVPEIHKLVNANGTVISNPDAIRIAMRRHPEVFNNEGGRYSLRNLTPREGATEFLNAEEATEVAS